MAFAAAALVAGVLATVCVVVAIAAWRAMLATGNRGIQLVSIAFGLLALKNYAKAANLALANDENPMLELGFSLLDLAAVGMIAWPLLRARQGIRP